MTDFMYVVDAACPHCDVRTKHVRTFEAPIPLMQSIGIGAVHCPKCGEGVPPDGWDVHEDFRVESAPPVAEVADE